MTGMAARAQAKHLIDFVPDDKLSFILNYIKSFTPAKKTSSKINHEKKAAYQSLLADAQPIQGKTLSLNGQDEVADIILKKYESIN